MSSTLSSSKESFCCLSKGAFIAGVQSQLLVSVFQDHNSTLLGVSNGFGFVGLTLDILGTSFGVLHSLQLHRSPGCTPERVNLAQLRNRDGHVLPLKIVQYLQARLAERQKFWSVRRYFVRENESLNAHLVNLFGEERVPLLFWLCQNSVLDTRSNTPILGADPVLSIGAGTVCLLISVLLLAASSQPLSTWVTCVVITLFTTVSMTVPMLRLRGGLFFSLQVV
jgi:hypothetical protein